MEEDILRETKAYNKGEAVPDDGKYVCVPCGYHHEYKKGDKFGECISCLAGGKDGPEEFAEGLEMWEKLETRGITEPTETIENTESKKTNKTTEDTEDKGVC